MKKSKKCLSLLLTMIITSAAILGCSGNSSTNSTNAENADTPTAEVSEQESPKTSSELKGPGNVTLSFLGFSLDFDPNTDVMAEVIEETTGYHTEYSMLPSDGADEKLIADVAGGVKYDILKAVCAAERRA